MASQLQLVALPCPEEADGGRAERATTVKEDSDAEYGEKIEPET